MHGDEPTIPNLRSYGVDETEGAPGWPAVGRYRLPSASPDLRTAMLGLSIGANVVLLVSLVGVLLLARAGFFAPGGSSTPPSPTIAASNQVPTTPSPTQSAPSPTVGSGSLQVAPTTVNLGCDNGQQTQFVVLANTGTEQVEWQADSSVPLDQAGVSISPNHGLLRAGASIVVRLQNRSHNTGQQGVIRFEFSPQDAGTSPSLSYTTQGCD